MFALSRRVALVLSVLPLVLYVGCKDDPTIAPPATVDPGNPLGGNDGDGGGNAADEAGASDAGDGGAAILESCVGNPLTNGADDGGVVLNPDGGVLRAIARGAFLDGPQWIDEGTGAIVYSEVNAQEVVRNGPNGGARTVLRETGPGNLPIGNAQAGGYIFTALSMEDGGGSILRMRVDGGEPMTFPTAGATSPNDVVGSSKGILYFTDPGFQAGAANPVTGVYQMTLTGGLTPVQQFNGGANPGARVDGIALSADGTTLYVGIFDEKRITRYTVDANGVASNPQQLAFIPVDRPTGLATDVGGNLWIAENDSDLASLRGRIEVIDPAGKKWGEIPFPDSRPTGLAFGGADGRTLYVTTERDTVDGTLYVFTSRCTGVR